MEQNLTLLCDNLNINDNKEKLQYVSDKVNTIIVITPSEGHNALAIANEAYDGLLRNTHIKIICIGNYTKKYYFSSEDHRKYELLLIPFPYAPFDAFTYFDCQARLRDVIEPPNIKKSKVSFIYFGQRVERDIIFCELYKRDLLENVAYHSDKKENNRHEVVYNTSDNFIKNGYTDFATYEKIKYMLPKQLDNHFHFSGDFYSNTIKLASNSLFYIVSESNIAFNDSINVATEKSAIPFLSKSIPIFITGNSIDALDWFENLGFDCFTDIISRDVYELSLLDKIIAVMDIIEKTDVSFFQDNIDRFNKNYSLANYFVNLDNTLDKVIEDIVIQHNLQIIEKI